MATPQDLSGNGEVLRFGFSPCELLFLQNICLANLISIYFPRVIILKNDLRCNFQKIIQIYRCVWSIRIECRLKMYKELFPL